MPVVLIHLSSDNIKKIISQGKCKANRYIVLYWMKIPELGYGRAIIISKKVDKRAVVRNRLRRIIVEQLRSHEKELTGHNMVIMVRLASVTLESKQLRKEVTNLLLKSGLI